MDIVNFKCPNCNAPLIFSGDDRSVMLCEYCDHTFEVSVLEELYRQNEEQDSEDSRQAEPQSAEWMGEEYKDMLLYTCPSCGAQIMGDASMGATQCLYCGNPTVIPHQFEGGVRPDLIIPFSKTKEDALNALKAHCRGKHLLPSDFLSQNRLQEIKGLYVPVWLFDFEASGDMTFNAQRVHTWSDSKYRYTRTDYYRLRRAGNMGFAHIPVDGSSKMRDDFMESIEPFATGEAVPFSMGYLSGYYADKYDTGHEACQPRADERAKASFMRAMNETTSDFVMVTPVHKQVHMQGTRTQYALLPVWILSTRYKDKPYTFVMNAQTGRFAGDLPLDVKKMWAWLGGLTAGISLGLALGEIILRVMGIL